MSDQASQQIDLIVSMSIELNQSGIANAKMLSALRNVEERSKAIQNTLIASRACFEQIHQTADQVASNTELARTVAEDGVAAVENSSKSMIAIATAVEQSVEQVTVLSSASEQIGDIAEGAEENVVQLEHNVNAMGNIETILSEEVLRFADLDVPRKVIRLAKADHVIWKKKLADMLVGRNKLTASELADHKSCRLGKWYYSDLASEYADHPAFKRLEEPHELVHSHGISAATEYANGNIEQAIKEVELVEKASLDVMLLLEELNNS